MENLNKKNYLSNQFRYRKTFKRKVFLSNEVKKSLFVAFREAKRHKTYVNLDLFLYGLFSQPTAFSSRLFSLTVSQYRNNKKLTTKIITTRLHNLISQIFKEKKNNKISNEFSSELWSENQKTPWLSPEVKEILKRATRSSLQTKKRIVVLNTKHIFFELLKRESICSFLRQLIN